VKSRLGKTCYSPMLWGEYWNYFSWWCSRVRL